MPCFNCESPQTGGSWEGQAQGRFSFSKAACKTQSLKPVGGRLVLLNFLITFSAGASFPFDAVLVSLAVVQGEYLISYGEPKGVFFFFLSLFLLTPGNTRSPQWTPVSLPCQKHKEWCQAVSFCVFGSSNELTHTATAELLEQFAMLLFVLFSAIWGPSPYFVLLKCWAYPKCLYITSLPGKAQ